MADIWEPEYLPRYSFKTQCGVFNKFLREHSNKDYPIISDKLEKKFHIAGPSIRRIVRTLRRNGEPIVATNEGYYYGITIDDVKLIQTNMLKRIGSMSKTISQMAKKIGYRFQYEMKFEKE